MDSDLSAANPLTSEDEILAGYRFASVSVKLKQYRLTQQAGLQVLYSAEIQSSIINNSKPLPVFRRFIATFSNI